MCGIVGYVGARPVREQLLAGLEKLEYRGYDSAGISVLNGDGVDSVRAVGNLDALRTAIAAQPAAAGEGTATSVALAEPGTGIGHTRWATHGRVSERNAHPHTDDERPASTSSSTGSSRTTSRCSASWSRRGRCSPPRRTPR